MATYNFRPAGFEDDSDDEDYAFGDDSYKPASNGQQPAHTNQNIPPTEGRGGFGAPPPSVNKSLGSSHANKKSGFPSKLEKNGNAKPYSKPVHQRLTKHSKDKLSATQNGVKSAGPSWSGPPDTVPIDDFRMAVMRNNVDAVQVYLDQGVPVDTVFSTSWTALMYAMQSAHSAVAKLLLDRGADPAFNKDMYTVLMAACSSTFDAETEILACVNLLLDKGVDVNSYDRHHMTALMYAARKKRTTIVKRLIEAGAYLDKQDNKGYTALIYTVSMNNIRTLLVLLEAGADINIQTTDGSKAVDLAYVKGFSQIEGILRTKEKDPKATLDVDNVKESAEISAGTEALDRNVSLKSLQATSSQDIVKYGDLEMFLSGLELSGMIPVFQENHVQFQDLLRLKDTDLQQMGIHQLGIRKKILDAIRDTHKKNWETSSLNSVQYNKKITSAEAVAMVTNIKRHATYIASTIGYITDQIKADKEILVNSQDGSGAEELAIQAEESITNVRFLYEELACLRQHLTEVANRPEYTQPDLIAPKMKKSANKSWLSLTSIIFGASLCGLLYYKRATVAEGIKTVYHRFLAQN